MHSAMATNLPQSISVVMYGPFVSGERGLTVEVLVLLVIGAGLLTTGLIRHQRKLKSRLLPNGKLRAATDLSDSSIFTPLLRSPKELFIVSLKNMDSFESAEKSINANRIFVR
jgi:hypothetical protein